MSTPPRDLLPKPTNAFIARKPCGCLSLVASDLPLMRAEAAEAVARAVMAGYIPGYVTHDEAHALPWRCDTCKAAALAPDAPPAPLELTASARPDAPRFLIEGTITYQVTVPVRAIVRADDEDKANEELADTVRPTSLYAEPDDVEAEWEGDDLTVTVLSNSEGAPELADQMPLALE